MRAEKEDSEDALAQLCRDYWYPLYAFVRRRGLAAQDAQDAAQGFFFAFAGKRDVAAGFAGAREISDVFAGGDAAFLANERRDRERLKRGGGAVFIELDALDAEGRFALEPADAVGAEVQFDRS